MKIDCNALSEIKFYEELNYLSFKIEFPSYTGPKDRYPYSDRATNCSSMIASGSLGALGTNPKCYKIW